MTWLEERMFHDREAELQPRVDRRRVRVRYTAEAELMTVAAHVLTYRDDLLEAAVRETEIEIDGECEAPGPEVVVGLLR